MPSYTKVNNFEPGQASDRYLVKQALAGDRAAFGQVIRQTEKLVAQVVGKMIERADDRKDVAQDVYLKAWKLLPSFRFECKLSTWIARISYTTCIDYLRKKKMVLPGLETIGPGDDESVQEPEGAHDLAAIRERKWILERAIAKLPGNYKAMIALYHQEELTYEEIGDITGMPPGTVKSYLFRARKMLRNELLKEYKKEEL